jgi:predicted dinucleotide-utilizing enzyme
MFETTRALTGDGAAGGIAPLAIMRATGREEVLCATATPPVTNRLTTSMSAERKQVVINGRGSREATAARETFITKPHFGSRTISKAFVG